MQDEKGQTTTEYGLILSIVSIAVIGIFAVAASSVSGLFESASAAVHAVVVDLLA